MGKVLVGYQTSRLPVLKTGSWLLICFILFPKFMKQPVFGKILFGTSSDRRRNAPGTSPRISSNVIVGWFGCGRLWQCPCWVVSFHIFIDVPVYYIICSYFHTFKHISFHIFHTLTWQRQDSTVSLCYPLLMKIDKDYATKHHRQLTYWMSCWIWLCQGWS